LEVEGRLKTGIRLAKPLIPYTKRGLVINKNPTPFPSFRIFRSSYFFETSILFLSWEGQINLSLRSYLGWLWNWIPHSVYFFVKNLFRDLAKPYAVG